MATEVEIKEECREKDYQNCACSKGTSMAETLSFKVDYHIKHSIVPKCNNLKMELYKDKSNVQIFAF